MMSYWAQFAYTGDPGRGRSGTLAPWKPWDTSSAPAPKQLLLDTTSGGGIRMDSEMITTEGLLARLERDDRFESEEGRCSVYSDLSRFAEAVTKEEYARRCPDYPMEE